MATKSVFLIKVQKYEIDEHTPWNKEIYNSKGSGFCIQIDKQKYIMTNHHVIENSMHITINDREAQIVYDNEDLDLAILKCSVTESAKPLEIGVANISDKIQLLGYSLGIDYISTTFGKINRIYKSDMGSKRMFLFQVEASSLSGNSGGPALNMHGDVIGVLNSGVGTSVSYCIPYWLIDFFIKLFLGKTHFKYIDAPIQKTNNLIERKHGKSGVLIGDKVYTTIEDIPITNGRVSLYDCLKFLGYRVKDDGLNMPVAYFISICGLDEIHFDDTKIKTKNYETQNSKPEYKIFGGYTFVRVTPEFNAHAHSNYRIDSVFLSIIITNEYNIMNKRYRYSALKCMWNDLDAVLKKKEIVFEIASGRYPGHKIFIDPKEVKLTNKTLALI